MSATDCSKQSHTVTAADPLKFDETSQSIYSPEQRVRVPLPIPQQQDAGVWVFHDHEACVQKFHSSCVLGLITRAPSGWWMSTGILCPKPYLLLWMKVSTSCFGKKVLGICYQ